MSQNKTKRRSSILAMAAGVGVLLASAGAGAQDAGRPSPSFPANSAFTAVRCGGSVSSDPARDSPAGVNERDIVGTPPDAAVYFAQDANFLYLRMRVGGNPLMRAGEWSPFGWGFEFDTDGDRNTYEYIVYLDGIANPDALVFARNTVTMTIGDPGDVAEQTLNSYSPATHALATEAGTMLGGTDYFVTLAVPIADLRAAGVPTNFTLVWAGTSSNARALSADIACHDGTMGRPMLGSIGVDPIPVGTGVDVRSPANMGAVNSSRPVIRGVAEPGATVTVSIDGGAPVMVTVDAMGNWSLTPSSDLTDGMHSVTATARDADGNMATDTNGFTVDTVAPVIVIAVPASGAIVAVRRPPISGTAEPNSTVQVSIDGGAPVTVMTDAMGRWTFTPTADLPLGMHSVSVTQTDRAGNTGRASSTFTVGDASVDTDGDGVPDVVEFGPGGMAMPRDTDMDGTPDFRDTDDDGDGVLTAMELGAGGFMNPRNSDAMVPAGSGTSDGIADYLDADDDGDGIPTSVERTLEMMGGAPDADMIPAYLDGDSDGDGVPDFVERGASPSMPRNSDGVDRPDFLDTDDDNDTIPTADEVRLDLSVNDDFDGDGVPSYLDTDSDADAMLDRDEGVTDRDMDMRPDFLDPADDTDGDGIADSVERGGCVAGVPCVMGDRDTDNDGTPDFRDPDDDGDGIPTLVERLLDPSTGDDFDMDGTPSYRDTDSDGDGDLDAVEAGAMPMNPANSDGAADGPDFLDTDSDNDCARDSVMAEDGAARVTPAASPDSNCSGATAVCDTSAGVCIACVVAVGGAPSRGCATSEGGLFCFSGATAAMNRCGCNNDGDCLAGRRCDTSARACVPISLTDAGADGAGADAASSDSGAPGDAAMDDGSMSDVVVNDAAALDGGASADGGSMDARADRGNVVPVGVLSGDGACACRTVNGAGAHNGGARALALLVAMGLVLSRRRSRRAA